MSAPEQITFDQVPETCKAGVLMCRIPNYGVRIIRHEQWENGPSYEILIDYNAGEDSITIEDGVHARHA